MSETAKKSKWQRFADWQQGVYNKHPMLAEFFVELFVAVSFVVLTLVVIPPSIQIKTERLSDKTSIIFVKNKGILEGDATFKVFVDKKLNADPKVTTGRQYVRHIIPISEKVYSIEIKDVPHKEEIEIEFNSGNIIVED